MTALRTHRTALGLICLALLASCGVSRRVQSRQRLGFEEMLLAEVGHLATGVLLVELDEVFERPDVASPSRQIAVDAGLQLE